jgi:hypothetical protein
MRSGMAPLSWLMSAISSNLLDANSAFRLSASATWFDWSSRACTRGPCRTPPERKSCHRARVGALFWVRKELVATLSVLITNLEPCEENYPTYRGSSNSTISVTWLSRSLATSACCEKSDLMQRWRRSRSLSQLFALLYAKPHPIRLPC